MSKQHRARGYGRYRAAPPKHAGSLRDQPTIEFRRVGARRTTPLLVTAAALNVVSVALIGAAITRPEAAPPPAPATLPRIEIPSAAPFQLTRSTAHGIRRKSKERPQILLGTPSAADLTRYCVSVTGPLSLAVEDGTGWACRRLLGAPVAVAMADACQFVYDNDDAYAKETDVWRCYRDGP